MPRPVIPMFVAFSAQIIVRGDVWKSSRTWLRNSVAPGSRCSVTWSFNWIVTTVYSPGGT